MPSDLVSRSCTSYGARIGRGEHKSYCILLSSNQTKETSAKLAVLERTTNGFEVAEADWELRGPGDVLGTAQSGLPALKIGDLKRDARTDAARPRGCHVDLRNGPAPGAA